MSDGKNKQKNRLKYYHFRTTRLAATPMKNPPILATKVGPASLMNLKFKFARKFLQKPLTDVPDIPNSSKHARVRPLRPCSRLKVAFCQC